MAMSVELMKKIKELLSTPDVKSENGPEIRSIYNEARNGVVYEENGLWGMKDSEGVVLYKPEFKLISKRSSFIVLLKPDGSYIKISKCRKEKGRLSEKEMPYVVNGKVGFMENDVVIVPPLYDNVRKTLGNLFVAEKDGKYTYFDNTGRQVLSGLSRFEGEDIPESRICLCASDFNVVTTCRYVGEPKSDNDNVVQVHDEWVELERYQKDEIMSMLINPDDDLALTSENLALLTNEFSYEFGVHFAQSTSEQPLHDCFDQLKRMNVFSSSWYYVVKIWQAPGEHIEASEFKYFRKELAETSQLGELTIAVGHDESLKTGEVRMLFITHYHERCFPASFEFEWSRKCRTLSICELMKAIPELKKTIHEDIYEKNQAEVYQDQLLPVLEEIIYVDGVLWNDVEDALEFFLAEGSPIKHTSLYTLFDAVGRIKHNEIDAALFYIQVALWALKHGSSVNALYKNKSPLDYAMELSTHQNSKYLKDAIRELKASLISAGAKSSAQLKLEERANKDYFKELEYMRLDNCSSKVMPLLA